MRLRLCELFALPLYAEKAPLVAPFTEGMTLIGSFKHCDAKPPRQLQYFLFANADAIKRMPYATLAWMAIQQEPCGCTGFQGNAQAKALPLHWQ